jgi:hypothetical protein
MAKGKNAGAGLLVAAATAAATALQDPKVREQLVGAGSAMKDGYVAWKAKRAAATQISESSGLDLQGEADRSLMKKLSVKFGNEKLELRTENLARSVELLRTSAGPDGVHALDEVDAVIAKISVAVSVAANLPFAKRQRAHREIDSALDELERAIFDQAMG